MYANVKMVLLFVDVVEWNISEVGQLFCRVWRPIE